jgi:hypothetical protein
MANIVFNKATCKVIKDVIKHVRLVSIILYYSQVLKHLLELIENYYLITTFVVLVVGVEAAHKVQPGTGHLPDQEAAASSP